MCAGITCLYQDWQTRDWLLPKEAKISPSNALLGTNYDNGVIVDEHGIAVFKVKPNALSSQNEGNEFRFKLNIDNGRTRQNHFGPS